MESPFITLTIDVQSQIIIRLSADALWNMLQVNQALSHLSKAIYPHRRSLEFYRAEFKDSCLYENLQKIVDGKLNEYFEVFVPHNWLSKLNSDDLKTTGALIRAAGEWKSSNRLQSNLAVEVLEKEEKDLVIKLQNQSIQDFLAISPSNVSELEAILAVARTYRRVEATLQLYLLFLLVKRFQAKGGAFFIVDGCLTRWLTGPVLELLVSAGGTEGILPHLIDCALGQSDILSEHSDQKKLLKRNAKAALSRLTDDDCWSLAVNQGPVLIDSINRQCFPIIDRFGPRTLEKIIEKKPVDDVLLVLLERFGAIHLSIIFSSVSLKTECFQKIVDGSPKFMDKLFCILTIEQLCAMVKPFSPDKFSCLLNSRSFSNFLEKAQVLHESSRPIFDPRSYLLDFAGLKPQSSFPDRIIQSQVAFYLFPKDIFEIHNVWPLSPDTWSALFKSPLLDKFTAQELLLLVEINIKAAPCIIEKGYLASKFTDLKDFVEFVLRYVISMDASVLEQVLILALANFKIGKIPPQKECEYILWYILLPKTHSEIFEKITDTWLEKLRNDCQDIHVTLLKKLADIQSKKNEKKQLESSKKFEDLSPSNIPKKASNPPAALLHSGQPSPEQKKVQKTAQPVSKTLLQDHKTQNNSHSLNIMSVLKGFFVGLLITGIAILLLMFINYQMNVPLLETINELWIAGVAGIFADLVATACFLVDAKVFEPSKLHCMNEEEDNLPQQQHYTQTPPNLDSTNDSKPLFHPAVETKDVPKSQVQQAPVSVIPVDNINGS